MAAPRTSRKKRLAIVVVVIAIAAAAFGLSGGYERLFGKKEAEPETLVLNGNVDIREVDLAIDVRERIARVLVEEGDQVKKGQLLAHAELEPFEAEVQRAQAALASQRAVVDRMLAGSRPQEIQ